MKGITKKQHDIYSFIEEFIDKNNFSPSYREIQEKFGFSSLGTVYNYIKRLKRKGMLSAEKQCGRSVNLTSSPTKNHGEVEIPLIGTIKAGYPIEMLLQSETITLPKLLVPHPEYTYALKAKGDSLNEELIAEGDLLIIEACHEVDNGDTIIALVNAHDTLIKRYYKEEGYIRLESKTPHHRPMIVREKDLAIQGHLTTVLRQF